MPFNVRGSGNGNYASSYIIYAAAAAAATAAATTTTTTTTTTVLLYIIVSEETNLLVGLGGKLVKVWDRKCYKNTETVT